MHIYRKAIYLSSFIFGTLFLAVQPAHAQIQDWTNCTIDGVPTLKCLEVVFSNLLFMSNVFIILVMFIMFVYASFTYMTSLGDAEKMEKAKGTYKWTLYGFLLYIGAYAILTLIDMLFLGGQGKIFQFHIGV